MKTIQLAIGNTEYAQSLRDLLLRDGTHRVYLVDVPDLRLDGVIVMDGDRPEHLAMLDQQPERFVVITHKGSDSLASVWNAGVRHVLFDGDPPNTAQLAIIAAELRLPTAKGSRVAASKGHRPSSSDVGTAVLDSPDLSERSCSRRMDRF